MNRRLSGALGLAGIVAATAAGAQDSWDGTIVTYGTMREAIGQNKSEGRVALAEVTARPHFYGIAALESLKGEITIFDSTPTVTEVREHAPGAAGATDRKATLLVGASVPSWHSVALKAATPSGDFDSVVNAAAKGAGIDTSKPFLFTAEGDFEDVRLHVINGACPMHARMQKIELPEEKRPYEGEYAKVHGKIVGIYADNAVGTLTHPGTSTHVHLVFTDDKTGEAITGHVERIGLPAGASLNLPR